MHILRILGYRLKRSSRASLLRIGSALIISKLYFGIGLTSTNLNAVQRILEPVYNDVVRQASGAFKSSPIISMMAETGWLPFHLAFIKRLCSLAVKLTEKNEEANNYPIVRRAKQILLETTGWTFPNICQICRLSDREHS